MAMPESGSLGLLAAAIGLVVAIGRPLGSGDRIRHNLRQRKSDPQVGLRNCPISLSNPQFLADSSSCTPREAL